MGISYSKTPPKVKPILYIDPSVSQEDHDAYMHAYKDIYNKIKHHFKIEDVNTYSTNSHEHYQIVGQLSFVDQYDLKYLDLMSFIKSQQLTYENQPICLFILSYKNFGLINSKVDIDFPEIELNNFCIGCINWKRYYFDHRNVFHNSVIYLDYHTNTELISLVTACLEAKMSKDKISNRVQLINAEIESAIINMNTHHLNIVSLEDKKEVAKIIDTMTLKHFSTMKTVCQNEPPKDSLEIDNKKSETGNYSVIEDNVEFKDKYRESTSEESITNNQSVEPKIYNINNYYSVPQLPLWIMTCAVVYMSLRKN